MKVALVLPPFDLMRQGYGSKKDIKSGSLLPLNVGYLASPLLRDGHQVKIIDSLSLNYQNKDIGRELLKFKPDIIGISALTSSAKEAYSLIKYLKNLFPYVPLIFGGAHVNCFAEQVIKAVPMADCLVYGEGEITFKKIVTAVEKNGRLPKDLPGTWIKDNGDFVKNPPAEVVMNLDEILPPAFELYNYRLNKPLPLQNKRWPVANLITSRGCPWGKCTFCFQGGRASQTYRRHSPERVVSEIKTLVGMHRIKEITFWDDNFLINEEWINKFCDLLDKEKINLAWTACGRVNTITKDMLARAKKSGLWCVFYGFETGNDDLLLRIKKGATMEQARQAAKWTADLGLDIRGSFMLALPGETPEKAMNTIDFAKELDVTFAQFLLAQPQWGTELYDDALNSGRMAPSFHGWTGVAYVPEGYKDAKEVRDMQKKAYRSFYFSPSFLWKHLTRIRNYDILKSYYQGLKYILGVSK